MELKRICNYKIYVFHNYLHTFICMIYESMSPFSKQVAIIWKINLSNALTVTAATGTIFHWDPKSY